MSWDKTHLRARVRRQGREDFRRHQPMFSLPRVGQPAQKTKAELREDAERAAVEWRRRYDPSDLDRDG